MMKNACTSQPRTNSEGFDPVTEAETVLAANGIETWRNKVRVEQQRLGRALFLDELLCPL